MHLCKKLTMIKIKLIVLITSLVINGLQSYGQERKKMNAPKVLIKETSLTATKKKINLHPSATIYSIDTTLTPPIEALTEHSKIELFAKLSNEKIEKTSSLLPDSLVNFGAHPFLMGMTKAYQEHRPFIISPDIIWTLIEQGFARHITLNSAKFRHRLVNFKGKKEITIVVNKNHIAIGKPNSAWETIFPQFVQQIEKFTGKDYVNQLRADFSTSTADSKIISEIILMESVKSYFDYRVMFIGCGISKVILEGELADWDNILQKINYIESFDLSWWAKELRPIIQEIIATKKGNENKEFWNNMIQLSGKAAYVPHETIDGWITKFYPFTEKGQRRELGKIISAASIAPEYVKVPFIAEDAVTKTQYPMEFWAGLFGMEQDHQNFALKPTLGWAILHRPINEQNNIPTKTDYDIVSLQNIVKLPDHLFTIKKVSQLEISFLGQIDIPDEIQEINILKLTLTGDIDAQGIARLRQLLPKTRLIINKEHLAY